MMASNVVGTIVLDIDISHPGFIDKRNGWRGHEFIVLRRQNSVLNTRLRDRSIGVECNYRRTSDSQIIARSTLYRLEEITDELPRGFTENVCHVVEIREVGAMCGRCQRNNLRCVWVEFRVEFGNPEAHKGTFGMTHHVDLGGSREGEDLVDEGYYFRCRIFYGSHATEGDWNHPQTGHKRDSIDGGEGAEFGGTQEISEGANAAVGVAAEPVEDDDLCVWLGYLSMSSVCHLFT